MTPEERLEHYYKELDFPSSLFVGGDERIYGTWVMGNNYSVKSEYYGGYPYGYLKRIKALFPDKKDILHLFSGRVAKDVFDGLTIDINPDNKPDIIGDAHKLSEVVPHGKFDLVLADPPYSVEDCEHYNTPMVRRNTITRQLAIILPKGAHVVWLDQVLPMYRKDTFKTVGYIGMVKSTNHRFRVITIFERI